MKTRTSFLTATAAFVAACTSLGAAELLQNNSFDQGSNCWHTTSAATGLNLWVTNGQVNLHIPGYYGNVINQDLNATNAASATVQASLTLTRNSPLTGNTIVAYLQYTDTSGATNRMMLLRPDNLSISNTTLVSTNFTLPANAVRLVRFDVDKEANGNFDLLEASLDVTIPLPVNPVVSKWFQILSTNAPGDKTLWVDAYNQIVTVGDTVHVTWMKWSQSPDPYVEMLCYRRSLDGGRTFEPTIVLDENTNGAIWLASGLQEESFTPQYLAADGTNVHIAISGQCAEGKGILYYRSTNAGAAFHPRRLLANLNYDEHAGPAWVTAASGKVTIAFSYLWTVYVTDPIPGSFGRAAPTALNSQDNGNTFAGAYVGPYMEFTGVFIGDVKQSDDTVAVAWRYTDTQPYAHGSWMRVAVSTNGGASFPFMHDVHGGHEGAFFCENMRLAVDAPNVYALWGASTNGTGSGAPPELFFARSTDNGVSFDAPIRLSVPGQDYYVGCGVSSAIAARGSNVYAMHAFGNQVLFHVSHDQGATFDTPRDLALGSTTLQPRGPFGPILIIDPCSAGGRSVHVFWCGDQYTRSDDGGETFRPAVHLGTYWLQPNWWSFPQAAVANDHAFLLTLSANYFYNDTDILFRRHGLPALAVSTNLGLHMEYVWDYPGRPADEQRVDNLQVPAAAALQFSNACTVEMWIRFGGGPGAPCFLEQDVVSGYAPISLYLQGYGWGAGPWDRWFGTRIGTEDGNYFEATGGGELIYDHVWHHVAMTYDAAAGASNLCLYVDGQINAVNTAAGLLASANGPIWIGNVSSGGGFNGDIDDLRFWNRARTPQEIRDNLARPLLGNEPGLVAYYPLDGTTAEVTGNGRDAVLMFKESFGSGADTQPMLRVDSINGLQMTVSWLALGSNYTLKSASDLASPNWQTVAGTPQTVNGRWTLTVDVSGETQFFRLQAGN